VKLAASTVTDTEPKPIAPPMPIKRGTEGKGVRSPFAPAGADEPLEISPDEIESVEDEPLMKADGTLDAWLAQLVFGYCPPDAIPFERPPPPTTFPGREQ
jgi:hypothetical protein